MAQDIYVQNFGSVSSLNGMEISASISFTDTDLKRLLEQIRDTVDTSDQKWQEALTSVIKQIGPLGSKTFTANIHSQFPVGLQYDLDDARKKSGEKEMELFLTKGSPLERQLPTRLVHVYRKRSQRDEDTLQDWEKDNE